MSLSRLIKQDIWNFADKKFIQVFLVFVVLLSNLIENIVRVLETYHAD